MSKEKNNGLYNWFITLPDRLYPFKTMVSGKLVRGIRAYQSIDAFYERTYGPGHYGVKLDAYRQIFHLAGSILFLTVSAFISLSVLKSDAVFFIFLVGGVAVITFQEFYLHRRMYRQLWRKGVVDWLAWCVPIGGFFFLYFY